MAKMSKKPKLEKKTLPNVHKELQQFVVRFLLNVIKLMMKLIGYTQC